MKELYQKAINEIDDYFEYRYESEKDKNFVISVIDQLANNLHEKAKKEGNQPLEDLNDKSD